jgi:nucleotidyltransferase/DNA polymerase involved in DNA repair
VSDAGGGAAPILYACVPGFYAAVERLRLVGVEDRPILVGGDPRKRGRVQAASAEAIARGVAEGMPMLEALERCPDARRVATDMAHYRAVSGALREALRREVEALEADGLGAAYLDLRDEPETASRVARALVDRVESETGLALAVGGGPTKGVARLAAESVEGAGGVRIVPADGVRGFLDPLPVDRLPGVGARTAATLAGLGAETVGDLRALPVEQVEEALGNHGLEILERAVGKDHEGGVRSSRHPGSLSRETALERPTGPGPELDRALVELSRALASGLARHDLRAGRIALRLRLGDGRERTRSATPGAGLQAAQEIAAEARMLLERFDLGGAPARGVRITLAGLVPAGGRDRQLDLFG